MRGKRNRDIYRNQPMIVEGADRRVADGATVTVDPVDPNFKVDSKGEGGGCMPHTLPGKSQRKSVSSGKTKREKQKHQIENSNRPYRGIGTDELTYATVDRTAFANTFVTKEHSTYSDRMHPYDNLNTFRNGIFSRYSIYNSLIL